MITVICVLLSSVPVQKSEACCLNHEGTEKRKEKKNSKTVWSGQKVFEGESKGQNQG